MNLREIEEKLRVLDSDPNGVLQWQDECDLLNELREARAAIKYYLTETRTTPWWSRAAVFIPGFQRVLNRVRDE